MERPSLWISTPCYGGQVLREFSSSILNLYKLCIQHNINVIFDSMENESLIPRGRCVAVGRFMQLPMAKDYTHFMFIDADIEFQPESVLRLLFSGHDVSVACYPKKYVNFNGAKNEIVQGGDRPPEMASADLVVNLGKQSTAVVNGFAEILDGPTGFMMIKREVFEKMEKHYPELHCKNDHSNRDFEYYPALFRLYDRPSVKTVSIRGLCILSSVAANGRKDSRRHKYCPRSRGKSYVQWNDGSSY